MWQGCQAYAKRMITERPCSPSPAPYVMPSLSLSSCALNPSVPRFVLGHSRASGRRPSGFSSKWKKTGTPDIKMVIHTTKFLFLCPFPLLLGFYEMWEMSWKRSLLLASALAQCILTRESGLFREEKAQYWVPLTPPTAAHEALNVDHTSGCSCSPWKTTCFLMNLENIV